MKRYRGNQLVEPGVYVNPRELVFRSLDRAGRLPGTDRDRYRRVSPVVLLLAAPVLGGFYVLFLPFIGVAMLAWVCGTKVAQLVARAALAAARVLRPEWTPGRAFLSRGRRAMRTAQHEDRWLEEKKKQLEEGNDGAP